MSFVKKTNNQYVFKSITDRGANGYQVKDGRPFLIPEFSPSIITLTTSSSGNELVVNEILPLKNKKGQPITGLPNHRNEENPIDVFGLMTQMDINGIDSESIVPDEDGGYWIGEEYSPSLIHFDGTGKMVRRLTPNNELPKIYAERKTNRGFEGIAKIDNHIFGILQSPLSFDKNFIRIVDIDLDSLKTVAEYFYPVDNADIRIGDIIALPDHSLLVLEQNGKTNNDSYKKIFQIHLEKNDELLKKNFIVDLNETSFKKFEKLEGLCFIDNKTLAVVNDNDFGITGETNFKTGITPLGETKSELLILTLNQSLY